MHGSIMVTTSSNEGWKGQLVSLVNWSDWSIGQTYQTSQLVRLVRLVNWSDWSIGQTGQFVRPASL